MNYLYVKRKGRLITLTLSEAAREKPLPAIMSWSMGVVDQYRHEGFTVSFDFSCYGQGFDPAQSFSDYCQTLSPVAQLLHTSVLDWLSKTPCDVDDALDVFVDFERNREALNALVPCAKPPKYSVKKQKQGPGVIMTLREDVIAILGIESARLCISALSKAIGREKGGPVGLYNPFTDFISSPAPNYASMSMWLMKTAFYRYLTDKSWTVAQVKEMLPSAVAIEGFFDAHALKA